MDNHKIEKCFNLIKNEDGVFLNFLKAKYPLFHNSNFFFRDFQYGIMRFLEKKEIIVSYPEAEEIAKKISNQFESEGIFIRVNSLGWRINYPDFVTKVPGDPFDLKISAN